MRSGALAAAAIVAALATGLQAAESDIDPATIPAPVEARDIYLVQGLSGRWSGAGSAQFSDGSAETLKCVVTYIPTDDATSVRQSIRCKSRSLEIQLAGAWAIDDGVITGTWEERKYSLSGSLRGRSEHGGFNFKASNLFLNANVNVKVTGCVQDIVMRFSTQVDLLTAALHKC